ncbi:MAG: acyltransferase [Candidatus Riflebacteria bacterium]|nr:acyltransferase [Candidatus Riflebacteria bacterium]
MSSFYSQEDLKNLGLGSVGSNVKISKIASIYSPQNVFVSDNVRIDDFCVLSGGSGISIGSFVHISAFVALYGGSGISIGNNCSISPFTAIFSESDDFSGNSLVSPWYPKDFKPGYNAGKVVLMDHSNVGSHCVIMPRVIIREGVAIGANSLVLNSCDEWSVYCGSPAKKIKERSKDLLRLEGEFMQLLNGEVQTRS